MMDGIAGNFPFIHDYPIIAVMRLLYRGPELDRYRLKLSCIADSS